MPVLTVIDTTGTQRYIFSSNRLRESIGASEIVACATSWWVFEVLRTQLKWETNLKPDGVGHRSPFDAIDADKKMETDNLAAEVVYAGGGNTLIVFASFDQAKAFAQHYTRLLIERAPGLEVVVAHSDPFDLSEMREEETPDESGEVDDSGNYVPKKVQRPAILRVLDETMQKVNQKKANRRLSAPLPGMAVTAQCVSTGGVATHDPLALAQNNQKLKDALQEKYRGNHVSAETFTKLRMAHEANQRLRNELLDRIRDDKQLQAELGDKISDVDWQKLQQQFDLETPAEFDDLGRTREEASFIAVVHTDGNGMGKRIQEFGRRPKIQSNRDWMDDMRKFSREINETNLQTLQRMIALLLLNLDENKRNVQSRDGASFALSRREEETSAGEVKTKYYLPFRPVIFGGEDVAFVCDGRIALALTAFYLKELSADTRPLPDDRPLYARAGVAIVKAHYPFRRAYDLAEDLARSAKEKIEDVDPDTKRVAALDWHIALTGLAGEIGEIRKREYTVQDGNLAMRPVSLQGRDQNDWRIWQSFEQVITEFQEQWKDKRNKVKALREALRGGKDRTREFLRLYRLSTSLPTMPNCSGMEKGGWHGDRCGYFDAIEMIDLFFSLDEGKLQRGSGKTQAKGGVTA